MPANLGTASAADDDGMFVDVPSWTLKKSAYTVCCQNLVCRCEFRDVVRPKVEHEAKSNNVKAGRRQQHGSQAR